MQTGRKSREQKRGEVSKVKKYEVSAMSISRRLANRVDVVKNGMIFDVTGLQGVKLFFGDFLLKQSTGDGSMGSIQKLQKQP